jgi:hypothetical protein
MRVLHLRPDLAAEVRELDADFECEDHSPSPHQLVERPELAAAKLWSALRPPILPNCTELSVGPRTSKFAMSEGPSFPVVEVFSWVANCPRLQKLYIGHTLEAISSSWSGDPWDAIINRSSRSSDDSSDSSGDSPLTLEDLGVQLPETLTSCELWSCVPSPSHFKQFWALFTWVKHLKIGIDDDWVTHDQVDFHDFDLLSDCLQRLSITGYTLDMYLASPLSYGFDHLVQLDCVLMPMNYAKFCFPESLRIINARLSNKHPVKDTVRDLSQAVDKKCFPGLERLKVKSLSTNLADMIKTVKLDARCAKSDVTLVVKIMEKGYLAWNKDTDDDYL